MKPLVTAAVVAMTATLLAGGDSFAVGGKPKYTIAEVMREAHKSGLLTKAVKGDRAAAERLIVLYTELAKHKPPEGPAESWKQRTEDMIAGARAVYGGSEGAAEKLKKAVNCGGCHKAHK